MPDRTAFAQIPADQAPGAVFRRSTSEMDDGLELRLCELIRTEPPGTIMISVSHCKGRWRLGRFAASEEVTVVAP